MEQSRLLTNDDRHRVLVTVSGGIAKAFYDASKVTVQILDYDDFAAIGCDPDAYLDDLVRECGFPDPRN